ncbi:MAG: DNA polymerase III subunit chi [Gammaproteobacteria bacterium]
MTRVDFYVLGGNGANDRPVLACRLAEKAFQQGHRVYIHTESPAQSRLLDDLLWTFRAGSFVPHGPPEQAAEVPVLIGDGREPDSHTDVLINLAPEVPLFFSRFARVAELVDQNDSQLKAGRERYRFYKERGYELASHKLNG